MWFVVVGLCQLLNWHYYGGQRRHEHSQPESLTFYLYFCLNSFGVKDENFCCFVLTSCLTHSLAWEEPGIYSSVSRWRLKPAENGGKYLRIFSVPFQRCQKFQSLEDPFYVDFRRQEDIIKSCHFSVMQNSVSLYLARWYWSLCTFSLFFWPYAVSLL